MSKSNSFLYQINFNRDKFPEICEMLEWEKENNGVAFYLRKLIQDDINRRRGAIEMPPAELPPSLKKKLESRSEVIEDTISREKEEVSKETDHNNNLPSDLDNGGFI
jgi:hypothetical protein